MFTVTVTSENNINIDSVMRKLGWTSFNGEYSRVLDYGKKLITMKLDAENDRTLIGEFAQNLSMKEYKAINGWLKEILLALDGMVNDENSKLGYLADGSPACILTNWEKWDTFLIKARLRSLEGKKVMALDPSGEMLIEGLLVEYSSSVDEKDGSLSISSCTVITLFGERTVNGEGLAIEAVYE
ncbi:hypothetical protein [Bacillus sp. FJAT-45066]|uniref:hypothetical protein n=1 Tax=Bacillus sp. FJAT-45066 TaxID=2011010 RepID=UPI000BB9ADE5|nr:hypothetical protein [Bacillus sp. FJAT-45066]